MDQKKIGKFIATLRKEKNLTQKEIAERLGISEKTVSKWECGNGLPEVVYMETTACSHPLIWEVVRSYIFMAPECKDGAIDIESFEHTRNRSIYLEQAQLSAKMLRWFDKHIEELNVRLRKLAEAM